MPVNAKLLPREHLLARSCILIKPRLGRAADQAMISPHLNAFVIWWVRLSLVWNVDVT
jgi:hypothetical protein